MYLIYVFVLPDGIVVVTHNPRLETASHERAQVVPEDVRAYVVEVCVPLKPVEKEWSNTKKEEGK